jgi:hypothetical protein
MFARLVLEPIFGVVREVLVQRTPPPLCLVHARGDVVLSAHRPTIEDLAREAHCVHVTSGASLRQPLHRFVGVSRDALAKEEHEAEFVHRIDAAPNRGCSVVLRRSRKVRSVSGSASEMLARRVEFGEAVDSVRIP